MKVLICNERFLFRFGLDRVLMTLAHGLEERGHEVTLMANRSDQRVVDSVATEVYEVPTGEVPYIELDAFTTQWVKGNVPSLFGSDGKPDLALIGGWPFLGAIRAFRDLGIPTVYFDCGAVPLKGMDEGSRRVQLELRSLRQEHLPAASAAISISRFILESQTLIDAPDLPRAEAILLGADHLAAPLWHADDLGLSRDDDGSPVEKVRRLQETGCKVIFALGRWEPGRYKRSEAILEVARELLARAVPDFAFIVLEQSEKLDIPADLEEVVLPIDFPDDAELVEIIKLVDAGISVSTWEGFNLPVAEMQWFGKPALALDLAAHPEVVCHSWCLAEDDSELADKLAELLTSGHPEPEELERSFGRFRERFTWRNVRARYVETLESIARVHHRRPVVVVDVSNACRDPANSGVMRVTRCLSRHLRWYTDVVFAIWDEDIGYVLPSEAEYRRLTAFGGPRTEDLEGSAEERRLSLMEALTSRGRRPDWLLLPEIVEDSRGETIRQWARVNDIRVAAIFYDAIAVLRPELVADSRYREHHEEYMLGLGECDLVLAISRFSHECVEELWSQRGITSDCARPLPLPTELEGRRRRTEPKNLDVNAPVEILCVSTLEPRKNHLALLGAVRALNDLAPGVEWRLTIIGNGYDGAGTIKLAVESAAHADPRIRWLGIVDDETLHDLYAESTLTVYASTIEGFGMPIVESLWHATPVLCHEGGVMGELADDGGCLTTDVRSPGEFARALARLATDEELYRELSEQATHRPVRSWQDYTEELIEILSERLTKGRDGFGRAPSFLHATREREASGSSSTVRIF